MYFFGWRKELGDVLQEAIPKLANLTDVHLLSRITWIQAVAFNASAQYAAACEVAEKSRQYARRSGVFFDYMVATMHLHWALVQRGDLGQASRIARDGAEMAARNASVIPGLWFVVREGWVHIEAFDFDRAVEIFEQHAVNPAVTQNRWNTLPLYLWLGMARLGSGNRDGARMALEILRAGVDKGGLAFQVQCPLLHAEAECELADGNTAQAETLARRLVQFAAEHGESGYEARGYRLLAELAFQREDYETAASELSHARTALERCESLIVEWRVHALAARLSAQLGRLEEARHWHEVSLQAAHRIAATLVDEPVMHASFLRRVNAELIAHASAS
jgi:tetratricopeptide (TPR) repeat protein